MKKGDFALYDDIEVSCLFGNPKPTQSILGLHFQLTELYYRVYWLKIKVLATLQ